MQHHGIVGLPDFRAFIRPVFGPSEPETFNGREAVQETFVSRPTTPISGMRPVYKVRIPRGAVYRGQAFGGVAKKKFWGSCRDSDRVRMVETRRCRILGQISTEIVNFASSHYTAKSPRPSHAQAAL